MGTSFQKGEVLQSHYRLFDSNKKAVTASQKYNSTNIPTSFWENKFAYFTIRPGEWEIERRSTPRRENGWYFSIGWINKEKNNRKPTSRPSIDEFLKRRSPGRLTIRRRKSKLKIREKLNWQANLAVFAPLSQKNGSEGNCACAKSMAGMMEELNGQVGE